MIKTLKKVESSMVAAFGYDREEKVLEVVFRKGSTWKYRDVPHSVYQRLCKADSIGGDMRDEILDVYEAERVR